MDERTERMIEQIAEDFAELPVAEIVATISDCAGEGPEGDVEAIERVARARLRKQVGR